MSDNSQNSTTASGEWFGHPRGLAVLFMTEMWERFSYYGMRALLIFYVTQHFLFDDTFSAKLYGTYAAMVYLMPVIGGYLADRYLGSKKAITFGAILLVLGHFGMAFEGKQASQFLEYDGQRYAIAQEGRGDDMSQYVVVGDAQFKIGGSVEGITLDGADDTTALPEVLPRGSYSLPVERDMFFVNAFYLSLALIIMGVGFLKANISTIVGSLYQQGDSRRDGGFTIFYMGINLGSVLATLLCGYLGQKYGWAYGFGLAGFGMLAGLVQFRRGDKHLEGHGEPPEPAKLKEPVLAFLNREHLIYIGGFAGVLVTWWLIQQQDMVGTTVMVSGLLAVLYVMFYSFTVCTPDERNKMIVAVTLIAFSVFFWALFEQAGSSMNLFANRNTDLTIIDGVAMQASQTQFFNPAFIVLLAPLFAMLWVKLGQKGIEPSTPVKFGLGLLQVGLGFIVLVYGTTVADGDAQVALIWLVLAYLLHTTGELCLSPVGLSMITKLSVPKLVGLMMGIWFFSSSLAHFVAGLIAAATSSETVGGQVLDTAASLNTYAQVFQQIGIVGIGAGVVVILISPFLRKGMGNVH